MITIYSYLKKLKYLDVSSNYHIRELKAEVFDGLDKLEVLYIKRLNDNFKLDVGLFQALPSLNKVIMDKRFLEMKPELSKIYGSGIEFVFV